MKRISPISVPLSDKRLLSVDEFRTYCGLGRNVRRHFKWIGDCTVATN